MDAPPTASKACVGQSSAADTANAVVGENDAAAEEGSGYYAAGVVDDSTNIVSATCILRAS